MTTKQRKEIVLHIESMAKENENLKAENARLREMAQKVLSLMEEQAEELGKDRNWDKYAQNVLAHLSSILFEYRDSIGDLDSAPQKRKVRSIECRGNKRY